MNFLAGLLIILCLYGGAKAFVTPVIAGFAQGCPLEGTLLAGDKITAIDGERIYVYSDVSLLLNLKQSGAHDPDGAPKRREGRAYPMSPWSCGSIPTKTAMLTRAMD